MIENIYIYISIYMYSSTKGLGLSERVRWPIDMSQYHSEAYLRYRLSYWLILRPVQYRVSSVG